jgi:hypothetical protein
MRVRLLPGNATPKIATLKNGILKNGIFGSAIAAALLATPLPLAAQSARSAGTFDGQWAVDVIVVRGTCEQGYSFPVRVRGGSIVYAGQVDIKATGTVGRDGRVAARFTRAKETLSASGRLAARSGAGTWTAPSRDCSGRWEARKES